VSGYASYQPYPGPPPALVSPPPILVAVADAAPQRRLTVAFRLLLVVPHAFVLYWLGIAAAFVAFIGWWGALFTGRLPQFAVTYLSGYLRWSTRLSAYDLLLTDVYPPFSFEDEPTYPVRVAIPEPQRLNRAAVFFRYFLVFPVALLAAIVAVGAGTLMAFIAWLVTLVAGHLPVPFHLAHVAVLRFQARVSGYWTMLTPRLSGRPLRRQAGSGRLGRCAAAGRGTRLRDASGRLRNTGTGLWIMGQRRARLRRSQRLPGPSRLWRSRRTAAPGCRVRYSGRGLQHPGSRLRSSHPVRHTRPGLCRAGRIRHCGLSRCAAGLPAGQLAASADLCGQAAADSIRRPGRGAAGLLHGPLQRLRRQRDQQCG